MPEETATTKTLTIENIVSDPRFQALGEGGRLQVRNRIQNILEKTDPRHQRLTLRQKVKFGRALARELGLKPAGRVSAPLGVPVPPLPPTISEQIRPILPTFEEFGEMPFLGQAEQIAKTMALPISLPLGIAAAGIRQIPGVQAALTTAERGLAGIGKLVETGDIQKAKEEVLRGESFSRSVEDAVQKFTARGINLERLRSPEEFDQFVARVPSLVASIFAEFIDPQNLPAFGAAKGLTMIPAVAERVPNVIGRTILGRAVRETQVKASRAGFPDEVVEDFGRRVELSIEGIDIKPAEAFKILKKVRQTEFESPLEEGISPLSPPLPLAVPEASVKKVAVPPLRLETPETKIVSPVSIKEIQEPPTPIEPVPAPTPEEITPPPPSFIEPPKKISVLPVESLKPIQPDLKFERPSDKGVVFWPIKESVRLINKYFTRSMGVSKQIDIENDKRLGRITETYFDAPLTGKEVRRWIDKTGDKAEEIVYDALRGDTSIEQTPSEIRPAIERMREDIDSLSKTLLENGVLSENLRVVINKNLGKYVTRAFRLFNDEFFQPSPEVVARAKTKLKKMRPKTLGALSDEEMDAVIQSILDKRDFRIFTADKKPIIVPQNHFIKRKDIPQELLDLYGEIKNPVWLFLKTVSDMSVIANNAKFLNEISKIPEVMSKTPTKGKFKQIDKGRRWGQFAGRFVNEELFDFLNEIVTPKGNGFIERFIVNPFKWSKTVGNVPSHPRNFLGNTAFSILADNSIVNPMNWKHYTRALKVILNKETTEREMWRQLLRDRVTEVQYWGSEMPKFMKELLKLEPPDMGEKIYDWAVKKPINFAGELYNAEDQIYRIATYFKYISKGMSREESALEVDKWFTNYSKVPLITKVGRKWAIFGPFLSFKSETLRIYNNAAKEAILNKNKGKLAKLIFLLGLPTLMSEISKEMNDIDDEELEKLNRVMPPYRRNGALVYYKDDKGILKAFDLTYILPTGDFTKAILSLMRGDLKALGDNLNLFEHPLISVYSIVKEGRNPYFNVKIRDDRDPIGKQIADTVGEIAKDIFLPLSSPIPEIKSLLKGEIKPGRLTGFQIRNLIDSFNEISDRQGRIKDFPEEVKNFLTGIRTWRVYPDLLVRNFVEQRKNEMLEQKRNLTRFLKDNRQAPLSVKEKKQKETLKKIIEIRKEIKEALSINLGKLEKREKKEKEGMIPLNEIFEFMSKEQKEISAPDLITVK